MFAMMAAGTKHVNAVVVPTTAFYNTLSLNGTSQYGSLVGSKAINLATTNFTIAFDCTIDSYASGGNTFMLDKWYDGASNTSAWQVRHQTDVNSITFVASGDGEAATITNFGFDPVLGQSYRYVIERVGANITLFVDGVEEGSGTTESNIHYNSTRDIAVGVYLPSGTPNYTTALDGSIANVSIISSVGHASELWNSGLSKQPSQYSSSITDDYMVAIPFNDGVAIGTEGDDDSGNGYNATLTGSPTYTGDSLEYSL